MNTGSMSAKTACDVAVIGGGAAGMMAALQAAWAGARVALLEKNEKLGKKIYITGKGRCNVTNVADIDDFFKQIPRNPRFLNAAARQFTHEDVTGLLEMLGTPTKVERGGRIFPESDKASDVTRALDRGMRDAGVVISLNTQVAHVRQAEGGFDVELTQGGTLRAKGTYPAQAVVLATGGVSYPSTGSTGDGYLFAKENGLNVTRLSASLVGLTMDEKWPTLLQGLSLKNVRITAKVGKKTIYSELGEMLFTHFGVSGPLVLSSSAHMRPADDRAEQPRAGGFLADGRDAGYEARPDGRADRFAVAARFRRKYPQAAFFRADGADACAHGAGFRQALWRGRGYADQSGDARAAAGDWPRAQGASASRRRHEAD